MLGGLFGVFKYISKTVDKRDIKGLYYTIERHVREDGRKDTGTGVDEAVRP